MASPDPSRVILLESSDFCSNNNRFKIRVPWTFVNDLPAKDAKTGLWNMDSLAALRMPDIKHDWSADIPEDWPTNTPDATYHLVLTEAPLPSGYITPFPYCRGYVMHKPKGHTPKQVLSTMIERLFSEINSYNLIEHMVHETEQMQQHIKQKRKQFYKTRRQSRATKLVLASAKQTAYFMALWVKEALHARYGDIRAFPAEIENTTSEAAAKIILDAWHKLQREQNMMLQLLK